MFLPVTSLVRCPVLPVIKPCFLLLCIPQSPSFPNSLLYSLYGRYCSIMIMFKSFLVYRCSCLFYDCNINSLGMPPCPHILMACPRHLTGVTWEGGKDGRRYRKAGIIWIVLSLLEGQQPQTWGYLLCTAAEEGLASPNRSSL